MTRFIGAEVIAALFAGDAADFAGLAADFAEVAAHFAETAALFAGDAADDAGTPAKDAGLAGNGARHLAENGGLALTKFSIWTKMLRMLSSSKNRLFAIGQCLAICVSQLFRGFSASFDFACVSFRSRMRKVFLAQSHFAKIQNLLKNPLKKIVCPCLVFFACAEFGFSQSVLNPSVYSRVMQSVYEIVVDKIDSGDIEYERELPMDRVSFSIRNDKYIPIGTAFRLTDGTFYTAAHVIRLYGKTIYKNYYIRGTDGEVHKIDEITAFSTNRDFVSFTVPTCKFNKKSGLKIAKSVDLNTQVFSVGNALGEGIVIRDGIYTSATDEDKNGEWKWMRFSAAASPGNSGGPLIKADGTVVGIVTMKSQNENLNYALPIGEATGFSRKEGVLKIDYNYVMPNLLGQKFHREIEKKFPLPQPYHALHEQITSAWHEELRSAVAEIRKDYAPTGEKSFDNSKEADEIFSSAYSDIFPSVVYLQESGTWGFGHPAQLSTYQMGDNGKVQYGSMMNAYFGLITKTDSVSFADLFASPRQCASHLLKAVSFHRNVAGEKIQITLLPEPFATEPYVDFFGRTWQVSHFLLDFADNEIVMYSLPLPNGIYVMATFGESADIIGNTFDLAFLADFTLLSYRGRMREWRDYLSLPQDSAARSAENEKSFSMKRSDGTFNFSLGLCDLRLPDEAFDVGDETQFCVNTRFLKNGDDLSLENSGFSIWNTRQLGAYKEFDFSLIRRPGDAALDSTKKTWNQILNRYPPYDFEPVNDESSTKILKVVTDGENADFLHLYWFGMDCKNDFAVMRNFAETLEPCVTVR